MDIAKRRKTANTRAELGANEDAMGWSRNTAFRIIRRGDDVQGK